MQKHLSKTATLFNFQHSLQSDYVASISNLNMTSTWVWWNPFPLFLSVFNPPKKSFCSHELITLMLWTISSQYSYLLLLLFFSSSFPPFFPLSHFVSTCLSWLKLLHPSPGQKGRDRRKEEIEEMKEEEKKRKKKKLKVSSPEVLKQAEWGKTNRERRKCGGPDYYPSSAYNLVRGKGVGIRWYCQA